MDAEISRLTTRAKAFSDTLDELRNEMKTVIVGQRDVIDCLLIALCADGHVLLEGVPGIAKTLTIRTLSQCIDCSFVRIQFTPDLLPADIMGTKILAPSKILHQNELEMRACSVFLNKLSFDSKSTFENHVKLRND